MKTTLLILAAIALMAGAALAAQSKIVDAISGSWGQNNLPMLELKFDGKSSVTGTTHWRGPNGEHQETPIAKGSYDAKKKAVRLEGSGRTPEGTDGRFVIVGTVLDPDTLGGTYEFGGHKGNFTFRRLAAEK